MNGMAVPHLVLDAPGGGGKVPIAPSYIDELDADHVVVRTYAGCSSTTRSRARRDCAYDDIYFGVKFGDGVGPVPVVVGGTRLEQDQVVDRVRRRAERTTTPCSTILCDAEAVRDVGRVAEIERVLVGTSGSGDRADGRLRAPERHVSDPEERASEDTASVVDGEEEHYDAGRRPRRPP